MHDKCLNASKAEYCTHESAATSTKTQSLELKALAVYPKEMPKRKL